MPAASTERSAASADYAACRAALRGGSRSFYLASWFLPPAIREPATALYAFCREADDLVDLAGADAGTLAGLHQRLQNAHDGRPWPQAADRALARTMAEFRIPYALPAALLEGFAWDAERRRYDTIEELYAYAARVAGSVGAMMALIMGARGPTVLTRACELGIAMQLSNIARDVGEDARAGRLYLPQRWLREAGIDPDAWLADPSFTPALGSVVGRLLSIADALYLSGSSGIRDLPFRCRPGIRAAQTLYAEIGREVARRGFDSVSRRATVGVTRKAWILASTAGLAPLARPVESLEVMAAVRFLIDAVPAAPIQPRQPKQTIADKVAWVVDLFERLERREQFERGRS